MLTGYGLVLSQILSCISDFVSDIPKLNLFRPILDLVYARPIQIRFQVICESLRSLLA